MKVMQSSEIPAFVDEVAATGCDITAVPGVGYIFGDADLPRPVYRKVLPEIRRISEHYGERDHLLEEITDYLISIGRSYPRPARY
ncbi:hypothetical protein [Neorhizobium sp. T7_12]|uniref:hypothetical protein n=1 Tax=Neorhizobium sp. T7_12 TaxID=2093832 RepID=UPI00352F2616